jgi:hypothetical protein
LDQGIKIQNLGKGKIEIKDIAINDREDCTKVSGYIVDRLQVEIKKFSGDLHRLWFVMQVVPPDPNAKIILDVGDEGSWFPYCQVVRATIKTDRGTATYEWK